MPAYRINDSAEAERAEIWFNGPVGGDWWSGEGLSASQFVDALNRCDGKPVDMHMNSLGGNVFDGFAIASAIRRYSGEVVCYVEGIAASAASYIAVACDRVVMQTISFFMIHNASATAEGNVDELEDVIARLKSIDDAMAGFYATRCGRTKEDVAQMMADEKWMSASEAVFEGFADDIVETEARMAACADNLIAAKACRKIPAVLKKELVRACAQLGGDTDDSIEDEADDGAHEPEPQGGEGAEGQEVEASSTSVFFDQIYMTPTIKRED